MSTIKEDNLNKLLQFVEESEYFNTYLISEADTGGLTYYQLRQFLAVLLRQTKGSESKKTIDDILKAVTKLEIMRVPVPVIRKQKTVSPQIFK